MKESMVSLDKFGNFIVTNLRDRAIEQHDMLLTAKLRGKAVQDLQSRIAQLPDDQKHLMRRVVIDAIDTAMHDLLFAFQDSHDRGREIEVTSDGENVAEISGMLHGELLGDNGWIKRFSKYR